MIILSSHSRSRMAGYSEFLNLVSGRRVKGTVIMALMQLHPDEVIFRGEMSHICSAYVVQPYLN